MLVRNIGMLAMAMTVASGSMSFAAQDVDTAMQSALSIGRVVGAAAGCPAIAKPRLKTVADRFNEAVAKWTADAREATSVKDGYDQGVTFGQRDISNRQIDCATADRELAVLENGQIALTGQPAPAAAPAATAQAAAPTAAPAAAPAQGPAVTMPVVQGVTENEILFGMVSAFSGPTRPYGTQTKLGIQTVFNMVNDAGGIHGRKFRLLAVDDGFDASRTPDQMKQLYEGDKVFGFIGNFGTTTTAAVLPYVLQRRVLFYAPFVAAPLVRRDPPDRYVFVYRPAVAGETAALTNYMLNVRRVKPEQIAVFYQDDGFGQYGLEGVLRAFRAAHAEVEPLKLPYKVAGSVNVDDAVKTLTKYQADHPNAPIKAVVMVPTMRPASKFIEKMTDAGQSLIYASPSGVGARSLADELMLLGPKYANGVIVSQAVPDPNGYSSGVLDYKAALKKYFPDEAPDPVSFEAYLSTLILMEGFKRAGPAFDTEKLVDALESIKNLDLSIGAMAGFSRGDHLALHKVWGTMLDGTGAFQPIDLE